MLKHVQHDGILIKRTSVSGDWRESARIRSGSTAITFRRQAELPLVHPAISSSVRPHPTHKPVPSSIAHTFTHGVSMD